MINPVCSKCGTNLTGDYKFCPSCGQEVGTKSGNMEDQILSLLKQNQFIEAVKMVRERRGLGLKESADYVRSLAVKHNIVIQQASGTLVVVAVAFVILFVGLGLAVYLITGA